MSEEETIQEFLADAMTEAAIAESLARDLGEEDSRETRLVRHVGTTITAWMLSNSFGLRDQFVDLVAIKSAEALLGREYEGEDAPKLPGEGRDE